MKYHKHTMRLFMLVLTILVIALPFISFAEIPAKEGFVYDEGNMLTSGEISSIEAEIDRAPFSLYLYTLESLENSSIEDIAKQTYQYWELAGSDVLLVIAKEEREVHMEIAIGSSFDKAIMESPRFRGNNQYTQFIDDAFIPYAIDGDFGQATVSVITQLQNLRDEMEANRDIPEASAPDLNSGGVGSGVINGANGADGGSGTGPATDPGMGAGVLVIIILIIVVVIVILLFNRRSKLLNRKKQLITAYQSVLGSIHSIEQELSPMVRLSQGKSQTYLQTLQDRFYHLLQEVSSQLKDVESIEVPVWVISKQTMAITNFEKQSRNFAVSAKEIEEGIKQYKVMEANAVKVVNEAKEEWESIHADLQKQKEQIGYPLDVLEKKNAEMKQVLEQCNHLITFDPESITEIIRELPDRMENLKQEIAEVQNLVTVSSQLPDKLQKARNDMDTKVQAESLLLTEIQPYAFYEQVDEQFTSLQEALQKGDVEVSKGIVSTIESSLEDGQQQIENTVRARDWNQRTIPQARNEVKQYDEERIVQLNQKLESLQETYSGNHWRDIPNKIEWIASLRPQIDTQLVEAEVHTSSENQTYFAGEKILQATLGTLKEMAEATSNIMSLEANLDRQYEQVTLQVGQFERELERAKDRSSQLFSNDIEKYSEQMAQAIYQTRMSLLQTPRDVEDCSSMLQDVVFVFALLDKAIDVAIKEKQNAEKSAADYQQLMQTSISKYKSHISVSMYSSQLMGYESEIQQAIRSGQYAVAYAIIEKGKTIARQMEKEYQTKIEQERRRREADLRRQRQAAAAISRTTSRSSSIGSRGGTSGFSSRGSSGGGSSFRSSGSRGGGSSFKSGGSRGGGSKW